MGAALCDSLQARHPLRINCLCILLARHPTYAPIAISNQAGMDCTAAMLSFFDEVSRMTGEFSLSDLLERMYENQLALEAALMELTLHSEKEGSTVVGENVRGALFVIGENAGHIKQAIAKLRTKDL